MLKLLSYSLTSCFLAICIFEFQFELLAGTFRSALYFIAILLTATIVSLLYLFNFRKKHRFFYLPFALLFSPLIWSAILPELNLSIRLHFFTKKNKLNEIERLSKESNIYKMTDMLRYQKCLNNVHLSDHEIYTSEKTLTRAFQPHIKDQRLNFVKAERIRRLLQDSDCISLLRTDGLLILTIDGFTDNEYGYVKSTDELIKVGDHLPPYNFTIVQLIELGDGWYYFFTT